MSAWPAEAIPRSRSRMMTAPPSEVRARIWQIVAWPETLFAQNWNAKYSASSRWKRCWWKLRSILARSVGLPPTQWRRQRRASSTVVAAFELVTRMNGLATTNGNCSANFRMTSGWYARIQKWMLSRLLLQQSHLRLVARRRVQLRALIRVPPLAELANEPAAGGPQLGEDTRDASWPGPALGDDVRPKAMDRTGAGRGAEHTLRVEHDEGPDRDRCGVATGRRKVGRVVHIAVPPGDPTLAPPGLSLRGDIPHSLGVGSTKILPRHLGRQPIVLAVVRRGTIVVAAAAASPSPSPSRGSSGTTVALPSISRRCMVGGMT